MIAVVWHIAGIIWSLCFLVVVGAAVWCAVGDWRRDRARRAEQRDADVRLARSRELPASLDDDPCLDPGLHSKQGCAHCAMVVVYFCSMSQPAAWDAGLAELHHEGTS